MGWGALMLGLLGVWGCARERPQLGVHGGRLLPCPASPNCVSSQAADDRHRIAPLSVNGEPEQAFWRLRQIVLARPDATLVEQRPGYLRVELRTRLFVDDAEFVLDSVNRLIQLRSSSRLGYSDLGTNRRRIEEIRTAFTQQMPE
jgi:uncharacterized protein (DUF1499 family)